jgi:FAD:protein FMN transferase
MHRVEHVMGMPILVDVRDDDVDERVFSDVFGWFRWVDGVLSTYKEDSEISRINRGELEVAEADPGVQTVLGICEELRATTDGYFDARAASSEVLDPSGLVKGWSVDRAAAILDSAGVRRYAVNAGGDLVVRGGGWRVGIQHPLDRGEVAKLLEVDDLAVATSAEYARGPHVLDPHTRRPPSGVLSVTITGPDLATADAYATAAFANGIRTRPALDGAIAGLSGVDDSRGRPCAVDAGFPRRLLVRTRTGRAGC